MLGAFAYLLRELDEGADLPVAFVEHDQRNGPALYEYRPLVRAFVEERASRLRGRDDAVIALEELSREPAAAIFARAHAGSRPSEEEALFRTVLLGLLVSTAEACGGFDWDDDSSTAPTRSSSARSSASAGRTPPSRRSSASRSRRRSSSRRASGCGRSQTVSSPATGPRRARSRRRDFGREADRYCVLELRAALAGAEEPPDAPAEIADARERDPARDRGAALCRPRPLRDA